MKYLVNFILSLVIILNNNSRACGPYCPSGEDMRFAVFTGGYSSYPYYSNFIYSASLFSGYQPCTYKDDALNKTSSAEQMNIILWKNRCRNVPDDSAVYTAVYLSGDSCYHQKQTNSFIKYLFNNHDEAAIAYLDFAKACGNYNEFIDDPWERQEVANIPQRKNLIELALKRINSIKEEDIKIRYAFLITRLSYYNGNGDMIKSIYEKYFSGRKNKNIIDYWEMYFRTIIEPKSAFYNYYASLVFANAPDKRFMISFQYSNEIPISQTLAFAKTKKEQAAVWLLHGIKNPGRAIESIEAIYRLDPHNDGLSFLLLREINKLEDWIYTPFYTNYPPSLSEDISVKKMMARIEKDKLYAAALLNLISQMNFKKMENAGLANISIAYLQYMNNDYASCLHTINHVGKNYKLNDELLNQVNIITALCLNANQQNGHAVIKDAIKPILMRQLTAKNYKFVFAVARDLEYRGNTTDAAILLSKLKHDNEWENTVYWKIKKRKRYSLTDYYENYFYYLDAQYSTEQMKNLISQLEQDPGADSFSVWKVKEISRDIPRLYDLLGTKYIRQNDLVKALKYFQKVNDTTWSSAEFGYNTLLNSNPFYTNFYAEHEQTKADSVHFTKESMTRELMSHLQKAGDINNKERSYHYFFAANCYFNMTQYGNSWMMRRYSWSVDFDNQQTAIPDNEEYFSCGYARYYYLKAGLQSRSNEFKALCLRMAGRCEKYRLNYYYFIKQRNGLNDMAIDVFKINKYYHQLKKQYPDYYDELIDNCESFDRFFKSGK